MAIPRFGYTFLAAIHPKKSITKAQKYGQKRNYNEKRIDRNPLGPLQLGGKAFLDLNKLVTY